MTKFTEKQIWDTAIKLGIFGHVCGTLEEFGGNISEFIEHPERIVPPTRTIEGPIGFPVTVVGNPNQHLHLAFPKRTWAKK